jgi:hypothetical protein
MFFPLFFAQRQVLHVTNAMVRTQHHNVMQLRFVPPDIHNVCLKLKRMMMIKSPINEAVHFLLLAQQMKVCVLCRSWPTTLKNVNTHVAKKTDVIVNSQLLVLVSKSHLFSSLLQHYSFLSSLCEHFTNSSIFIINNTWLY